MDDLRWASLEWDFPLEAPSRGGTSGFGSGAGRLGGSGGVKVLDAKKVGSFAAYVLQATDGKAMKGWLERNRFETTPASEAWLARYVKLGFYFAALRFVPGFHQNRVAPHRRGAGSETLRITFRTPVPYYPYHEPDRDDLAPDRALALWLVTKGKPRIPIVPVREGDAMSYRRPWREGYRRLPVSADQLSKTVGEAAWKTLAPAGDTLWQVQVFEDQKRARRGFGDVLLVPEEPQEMDARTLDEARALLPLLDPALEAP